VIKEESDIPNISSPTISSMDTTSNTIPEQKTPDTHIQSSENTKLTPVTKVFTGKIPFQHLVINQSNRYLQVKLVLSS
jgi:hypothetical protein